MVTEEMTDKPTRILLVENQIEIKYTSPDMLFVYRVDDPFLLKQQILSDAKNAEALEDAYVELTKEKIKLEFENEKNSKIVDEIRKQIDERIKYTENEIEEFHEPLGEELSWLKKLQSIIDGEK